MSLAQTEWPRHLIFNPFIGCKAGGVSTGCKNCTARHTAMRNAYACRNGSPQNSGFGHEACAHVLSNLSKKNDCKVAWNGEVVYNPHATKRLEKMLSPREILVGMSGDIGYADSEQLERLITTLVKNKRFNHHFFTLVTKHPQAVAEVLRGIKCPHNLGVYVSVESEKYMHRVDVLRELTDSILKGVWLKPFIGPFSPGVDFTGMIDVVAAGEIANAFRPLHTDSLINCSQAADLAKAKFTLEGLAAKDWLSAKEHTLVKKLERQIRRHKKGKK